MLSLTPELCRAARALLAWGQRELAQRAGVSGKTIADFELGVRRPYDRTLRDLIAAFEAGGVHFIEAQDGIHAAGVSLRWGAEPGKLTSVRTGRKGDDASGLDACGWEDDASDDLDEARLAEMAAALREVQPLVLSEEERRAMADHWRAQPERWAALHEISRQALLQAMGLERLG